MVKEVEILYIIEADFSIDSAMTQRAITLARALLMDSGFNITLLGYGYVERLEKNNIQILQINKGQNKIYKGLKFTFRGIEALWYIKKNNLKPDLIIYYGCSSRFLLPLLNYSKKMKIQLIADVVEWYDYSPILLSKQWPLALDFHLGMTRLIPKCDKIITISTFLEKYYRERGKITLRIPALIDTNSHCNKELGVTDFDAKMLNLIYAGIPGKKDMLSPIIKSVIALNKTGYLICLHILGLSNQELKRDYGLIGQKGIVCHGKVDQQQVKSFLQKADFSVLLRTSKRNANAGFPTKFVESLNAALPVIANYTSDLEQYLIEGYNGFVVNGCSENDLTEKLKIVYNHGREVWGQMRENALNTAKRSFDFRLYTRILASFISQSEK